MIKSCQTDSRGLVTLDAALALAVLGMALGALLPVAFGEQAAAAEAAAERQAVMLAGQALDAARHGAEADFAGVLPYERSADGFLVSFEAEATDLYTKRLTATVTWPEESIPVPRRTVRLTTLVSNGELVETCGPMTAGDWRQPSSVSYALADLIGDSAGSYPITGLDAYDSRLYVTTSNSSAAQPTLFVFDLAGGAPTLLGSLDNDRSANTGPAAVVVAPQGGRVYSYLASASSFVRGQLQVVDVTAPALTGWRPSIVTYKLPTAVVPAAGLGNSITYRHGLVALGLTSAPGGNEVHFFDVRDPAAPVRLGGYALGGHAANALLLREDRAYVAHPGAASDAQPEQLTILDASDPLQPIRFAGFESPGGIGGNGRSVAVLGQRVFLGRTATRISGAADALPEIFGLETDDSGSLRVFAAAALATPESVNALIARSHLAFALTTSQFQVWDFEALDPPALGALWPTPRPFTSSGAAAGFVSLPGKGAALDCEGATFYAGSNLDDHGYITVISSAP